MSCVFCLKVIIFLFNVDTYMYIHVIRQKVLEIVGNFKTLLKVDKCKHSKMEVAACIFFQKTSFNVKKEHLRVPGFWVGHLRLKS